MRRRSGGLAIPACCRGWPHLIPRVSSAFWPGLTLLVLAQLLPLRGWAETTRDCGSRKATFDYSDTVEETAYASLSTAQQSTFEDHFCTEVGQVENFFGPPASGGKTQHEWWQPAFHQPMGFLGLPDPYVTLNGTFDGPYPNLRVLVSSAYQVSESLVPAALGHRGKMQFPYYEVPLNNSAIDHELIHVFFPNGNRFLGEGLAIYVQDLINSNPAFPDYGQPIDSLVGRFVCRAGLGSLAGTSLVAQLDKVSTPSPLSFHIIGKKQDFDSADTYPIAGSFVKFVISQYGWDLFHQLYLLTPLVPFDRNEGDSGRWQTVYQFTLADLESQWQNQFSGLKCP